MAIDRKKKIDRIILPGNPYLKDPAKGLKLIASLFGGKKLNKDRKINDALDGMIGACGRLDLAGSRDNFSRLRQTLDLLQSPVRNRLLGNTAIVGFGGQFSSGKSSVLNSLLEGGARFRLPENMSASTCISTYMMRSPQERVVACSLDGNEIALDADGLAAISHQFRSIYKINLAQYIDFIGISLPQFPIDGVALLDTPGYNASDVSTQQEHRDNMRSQRALSSVDHLVWIISAKEPLLTNTDRCFIQNLKLSGEITVIVNKCDQVPEVAMSPEPESSAPIQNIKRGFAEAEISVSAIIPYCAREPEWHSGRVRVLRVLQQLSEKKKSARDRESELENIIASYEQQFKKLLQNRFISEMSEIDACIDSSQNPLELSALTQLRGMVGFERSNLRNNCKIFNDGAKCLCNWLKQQKQVSL